MGLRTAPPPLWMRFLSRKTNFDLEKCQAAVPQVWIRADPPNPRESAGYSAHRWPADSQRAAEPQPSNQSPFASQFSTRSGSDGVISRLTRSLPLPVLNRVAEASGTISIDTAPAVAIK